MPVLSHTSHVLAAQQCRVACGHLWVAQTQAVLVTVLVTVESSVGQVWAGGIGLSGAHQAGVGQPVLQVGNSDGRAGAHALLPCL